MTPVPIQKKLTDIGDGLPTVILRRLHKKLLKGDIPKGRVEA